MRWSQIFIPTLREAPAEAEVPSHILLLRGGYVRQLASGIYSYLPLAQRVVLKITRIIRDELDRMGAQEFALPALHPAEIWQESGRWEGMGPNMFRLKDRSDRDMCLGMTHEEVFASIARNELRSYRQLPQIWYQIQTKFRDEPRPKSGLLRVRQFTMKDSYSFDVDWEGLDRSYRKHYDLYCRIYDRCGLRYRVVEASSGMMGGSQSHEFMVLTDAGEDMVVHCACGYAANLEKATAELEPLQDEAGPDTPQPVPTPGQKTIDDISRFLGIPASRQIKSLIYRFGNQPLLVLVRGDHQLNEAKLHAVLGGEAHPALPEEIPAVAGADAGSLGPVEVAGLRILSDHALHGRRNLTCGANRNDFHLSGVTPGRDYQAEYFDLRVVQAGEACARCRSPLSIHKALEVGHIFKLGTSAGRPEGASGGQVQGCRPGRDSLPDQFREPQAGHGKGGMGGTSYRKDHGSRSGQAELPCAKPAFGRRLSDSRIEPVNIPACRAEAFGHGAVTGVGWMTPVVSMPARYGYSWERGRDSIWTRLPE